MSCAWQASTQGLVRELQQQGRAEGARVLCPVPLVTGGLVEPPVVPKFLQALEVILGYLQLSMLMSFMLFVASQQGMQCIYTSLSPSPTCNSPCDFLSMVH